MCGGPWFYLLTFSCSFWGPSGFVLGPIVFLTFITNLCHIPFSSGSKLVLYADDITLYKPINSRHDFEAFQENINKIYDWFTTNILQANAKKTKAMVVSLQNITHIQTFSSTLTTKLLRELITSPSLHGIRISAKLSQNIHILIPVLSTSLLVALRSVKEVSFILGLNFVISCLKMLRHVSFCLPLRLLSRLIMD